MNTFDFFKAYLLKDTARAWAGSAVQMISAIILEVSQL